MLEISRSWASRSKIPPYLLELFLEIRDAVLERSDFFLHKMGSLLNEVGFYKDEEQKTGLGTRHSLNAAFYKSREARCESLAFKPSDCVCV